MIRTTRKAMMAVFAVGLVAIAFQVVTLGSHSWGGYHWARTANPFTVKLGDNVSSVWDGYLNVASADWSHDPSPIPHVLNTVVVAGQSPNARNCKPTAGRVEVCNAAYGNNGWLGVAQIWISNGTHITQGTMKLNDTYFNTSAYNTPAWRQMVTCQEIGHTFGLDHQDEDFNNPNLGTCMDYTSNPATNMHPNTHDYEELAIIYQHLDSTTTLSQSAPGSSNASVEQPNEWGQLMKVSKGGRTQIFERDLGNGHRVVTFVIWA